MLSHVSQRIALQIFAAHHLPPLTADAAGPLAHAVLLRASLSIPDTLFLFVVALVVFGPKRLPEIGKQIGKLVFEFRRASNDFKLQIEEELRLSDQQERQKQIEMQAAAAQPVTPVAISADTAVSAVSSDETIHPEPPDRSRQTDIAQLSGGELTIHPPASGLPVAALAPNHNAVMMPIPPAQAPPVAEATPVEEAAAEQEAAVFEPQPVAHNHTAHNHG